MAVFVLTEFCKEARPRECEEVKEARPRESQRPARHARDFSSQLDVRTVVITAGLQFPVGASLSWTVSSLAQITYRSSLTLSALSRNHIYWTFLAQTAHTCSPDADEDAIVETGQPSSSLPLTLLDILPPIVRGVHLLFLRTLGVRNFHRNLLTEF